MVFFNFVLQLSINQLVMKRAFTHLLLFVCTLLASVSHLQAQLSAGDIAIVEMNTDTPDKFAFVALVDIPANEVIKFTDNGWKSSGAFRANESTVEWTAPATGVSCGSVVHIEGVTPSVGTTTGSLSGLSSDGDQILAYQGTNLAPSFIYALNNDGSAVWQANATSPNTSALPTGLIDASTAVAVSEVDNIKYNGTVLSGTKAAILAAISNTSNWSGGSNSASRTFSGAFTVSDCAPIPCAEPTTQTTNLVATPGIGEVTLSWTKGNGAKRIIVARETVAVTATPTDGTTYTANSTLGAGQAISTGQFVVYDGAGTSVTITGLTPSSTYHFAAYEYACAAGNEDYLTTLTSSNKEVVTTPATPLPTVLNPGDMAIIGYDNRTPYGTNAATDKLSIVTLVDMSPGTSFWLANMVYEMYANANQRTDRWYNCTASAPGNLAAQEVTYNGAAVLPAGSVICLIIPTSSSITDFEVNGVTSSDFSATGTASINLSSTSPDAFFLMQGAWTSGGTFQTFNGSVLGGIQTGGAWYDFFDDLSSIPSGNDRRRSRIPQQIECFAIQGRTSTGNAFAEYIGIDIGSQPQILSNIVNFAINWVDGTGTTNDDIISSCTGPYTITASSAAGVWTGNKNSDWFDCANWQDFTVPNTSVNVLVDGVNSSNICEIDQSSIKAPAYNSIAECKDLTINDEKVRLIDALDELHITGDLVIESGSGDLDMNTSGTDGTVFLHGDWDNQDNRNAFDQGEGTIQFVGTTDQLIATSDAGGVENFNTIVVNKPGGKLFNLCNTMNIHRNATFTNGIIDNNSGGDFFFNVDATTSGASNNSYIDGPVIKETDAAIGLQFTFPTGDAGIYGAIGIETTQASGDIYTAEYFYTGYGNYVLNTADLSSVSSTEYWELEALFGGDDPTVTLHWGPHSNMPTSGQPLVAHFYTRAPSTSNQWEVEGKTPTTTGTLATTGTVTSTAIPSFSPFTFGFFTNTLDIDFLSFTAKKQERYAQLNWQTENNLKDVTYYVERSVDGVNFETISNGIASNYLGLYTWLDKETIQGNNYYRIRAVEADGLVSYTKLQVLTFEAQLNEFKLYPNPASKFLILSLEQETNTAASVQIYNTLGQLMLQENGLSSNQTRLNIEQLPSGTYTARLTINGVTTETKSFVKQ